MVSDGRSALLSSIQKGSKLKKVATNDRSTPLGAGKVANAGKPSCRPGPASAKSALATQPAEPMAGHPTTAPNFHAGAAGGLFANGIPKLKKSAESLSIRERRSTEASAPAPGPVPSRRPQSMAAALPPLASTGEPHRARRAVEKQPLLPPFLSRAAPRALAASAASAPVAPKSAYCWNFPLGLPKPRSFSSIKSKSRTYMSGSSSGSCIPMPQ